MTKRLLDFSESPASLSLSNGLMVIDQPGRGRQTVALEEIGAVVTSHRQIVLTQSLIAALGREGAVLVCCDERHHPCSMLLSVEGHFAQGERFRAQASAGAVVKKRVWRELVRAKLRMQGAVLRKLWAEDFGLAKMADRVKSGDAGNLEAAGAQRYWPRLFQDTDFRRGDDEDPRNGMLNYGYAVMRALTARGLCASGLHPTMGVNHRNRYNAFCLADDLMEPLRPLVDYRVADLCRSWPKSEWGVNKTAKTALLGAAAGRYEVGGELRTLFDIVSRRAQALARLFEGEEREFRCEDVEIQN